MQEIYVSKYRSNARWELFAASAAALFCLATVLIMPDVARAANVKDVSIQLDWVIQGTHAPFFVAEKKGYFKTKGINPRIDAGKGATNVAVNVASGAYDFGWVDLPSMIRFNAQNPGAPLIAVYMSFDETPLAVITVKSAGIRKPSDLNGRKIAGGPGTAVHDTISILLKAAHAENTKIEWVAVSPQLFGPMLKKGEVVGTGGFTNSNIPAALEVGFKLNDLYVLKYSDFGADLYGLALVTRKQYAEKNPDAVKGVVWALNKGTKGTIADPAAALQLMKLKDPMMRMDIEKVRLNIALGLTDTPWVQKHGLSSVTPDRLQKTIDATVAAYNLPNKPAPDSVYTDKYLPAPQERMPPPLVTGAK